MRPCQREIASGIAETTLLLLERSVVLLIDEDQAERRHRREDRRAGADDEPRLAGLGAAPGAEACAIGEPRMHHRQRSSCKPGSESADELRREPDLWHQDEHTAPCGQSILGEAQVDLGLAAARHAVQQPSAVLAAVMGADGFERGLLRGGRRGAGSRCVIAPVSVGVRRCRVGAVRRAGSVQTLDPSASAQRPGSLAPTR